MPRNVWNFNVLYIQNIWVCKVLSEYIKLINVMIDSYGLRVMNNIRRLLKTPL